jgi:hypothetical protein
MRIYKTKLFNRWADKEGLTDQALKDAVDEMESGLIDADLGGHVYKKRAAIEGQGKSAGLRTILAFKVDNKAFFMFGFAKNQRANVNAKELKTLKLMAKELLGYSTEKLNKSVAAGSFIEVKIDEK